MFNRTTLLVTVIVLLTVFSGFARQDNIITEAEEFEFIHNPPDVERIQRTTVASDANWSTEFFMPGFNSHVRELFVYNGDLYATGTFNAVNDVPLCGLARWDGTSWSSPISNLDRVTYRTFAGTIYSMTEFNNDMIVGGSFTNIDGQHVTNLARFDGSNWYDIGAALSSSSDALVLKVLTYNNELIIGGRFTSIGDESIQYLAAWDGSTYSTLNVPIEEDADGYLSCDLISYDGKLYLSGRYSSTLGDHLLCFDGSTWTVAFDETGGVPDLRPMSDASEMEVYDNKLFVHGKFMLPDESFIFTIAAWDGVSWTEIGPRDQWIDELGVHNDVLYMTNDTYLYYYEGAAWVQTSMPSIPQTYDLVSYNGDLVVTGNWIEIGSEYDLIAKWDGTALTSFDVQAGKGLDSEGKELITFDNQLICGGWFFYTGLDEQPRIATYDGVSWSSMGDALNDLPFWWVTSMHEYNGNLLVSGYNSEPEAVVQWDGANWSEFLNNLSAYDHAEDIVEYNGMLVMGGNFKYFDGVDSSYNLLGFDGINFHTFGSGFRGIDMGGANDRVFAVDIYDNKLVAGGFFTYIDGVLMPRFGAWDGTAWSDLGFPFDDWWAIRDIVVHDGYLYVAGDNIARYDGSSWELVGDAYGIVNALYSDGPNLIVGGNFTSINDISLNGVAVWDGSCWGNFGSGIDGEVEAIQKYQDKYYFTGIIWRAGEAVSNHIAVWEGAVQTCVCCTGQNRGDVNYDLKDSPDISDLLYLVDYFFAEPAGPGPLCVDEADVNASGVLDVSDLLYLVDYFFQLPAGPAPMGCP